MSTVISSFTTGFNDWKHGGPVIEAHRNSEQHRNSGIAFINRQNTGARVDSSLTQHYQRECEYWTEVLRRCVDVLKLLCSRGLSIRGHDDLIGSVHNGNFLGIVELLSKYDSFLATHIKNYANKGSGTTSYLSKTVYEELIEIMADHVLIALISEIKQAKFYSVSVDSTPDISHIDQLTFTIRYVLPNCGPVERFLEFIPMQSHTGKAIASLVLDFLEKKDISIRDCRGQSYDNASNMSGKYKGTQAVIREACPEAVYVPCMAHSLNLVGKCAADSCPAASSLFSLIERIYTFLSASTHRWKRHVDILKTSEHSLKVDKQISETRWSARGDAVTALRSGFSENVKVLEELSSDGNQPADTRAEAVGLLKGLQSFETVLLLEVWNHILKRFQATSLKLQATGLSLNTAVCLLESLLEFVTGMRDEFDLFEEQAKLKFDPCKQFPGPFYKDQLHRKRKRKHQFDESASEDTILTGREKFRIDTFITIIENVCSALKDRLDAYSEIRGRFGFLSDLLTMTTADIQAAARNLVENYPNDLEQTLESELVHFAKFVQSIPRDESSTNSFEFEMFEIIHKNGCVEVFSNVEIMLRIYLCMFVTNCTGERSFSKLKIVKNYLRNSMGQDRVSALTLLSIEHETLQQLDCTDIIHKFASLKARKVPLC